MTTKAYITGCELFQYSKENFSFIKECHELELISQYLKNQSFLRQNPALITESATYLEADFFCEMFTESEIASLKAKFQEKLKGMTEKSGRKMAEILEGLITIIKALLKKNADINKAAEEIIGTLSATKLSGETKAVIQKIVEDAVEASGAAISEEQSEGFHKLPENALLLISDDSLRNKLAAALVNSLIHADISSSKFKMALNERQLSLFFDELAATLHSAKTETAANLLRGFHAQNIGEGIKVTNNPEVLEKLIASLENSRQEIVNASHAGTGVDSSADYGAGYNKLFNDAVRVAGKALLTEILFRLITRICKKFNIRNFGLATKTILSGI